MATTQELDEAEGRRFLEALGWFVFMFSIIEQQVQNTLWHFTKVDPIIARCILSGTRIDAAFRQLKRIAEATEWPANRKHLLDHVTQRMGDITRFRNDLLHYGISGESSDTAVVTNEKYAHVKSRIRTTNISAPILDQKSSEMVAIMCLIGFIKGDIISLDDVLSKFKQP